MKIDGLTLPQLINIKGLNNVLEKLVVGDKFEAQVIAMDGNELKLRLANGQNVSATTTEPIELTLGDFLQLAVKSKAGNQIMLQTLVDANEQTKFKDVGDTLMSLKLPPDERNFEIGTTMINQHLPLSKENFKTVFNILGTFEDVDINKAVFIAANNIQNIPEGKELLDKLENNQMSIGKSINRLIGLLYSNVDEPNLNKIFSNFETQVSKNIIGNNNEEIQNIINNYIGSEENDNNLIKLFIKQTIAQSNSTQSSVEAILNHNITEQGLKYLLDPESNKELFQFTAQTPGFQEKLLNFLNDKSAVNKVIQYFSQENPAIFKRLSNFDSQSKIEVIQNFFQDVVNNIKNQRIKKDIDVNKLYNDLELKLELIENHVEKYNVSHGDKIQHLVEQMKSEMGLIKSIDNMFNFYQLPFVINQHNAAIDMYILKNSREHRKIDADNATLFLSLNTQNLGLVEVLVHVQHKVVSFNFRLDDDKTINFFKNRQNMLESLLSNRGFTSGKVKYAINSTKTNVINFVHVVSEDKNTSTVFDIKI